MSIVSADLLSAATQRCSTVFKRREVGVVLCYFMGLIATQAMGVGGNGQPLLAVAAPAAIGMLIRLGGRFETSDLFGIVAASLAMSLVRSDPFTVACFHALSGAAQVAAGLMLFRMIRRLGLIRSPVSLMGALAAVAVASPLAPMALEGLRTALEGSFSLGALAVSGVVDLVSTSMILAVVVTQGRGTLPMTAESGYTEEKRPGVWEYASAASFGVTLIWFSLGVARPETAIAGSVALLWFALRLGLFPTTVAAFAFAVVHLRFGASDGALWALASGDPVAAELVRYLSLAFLTAPSILVATVIFDQQRLKRMFAYKANHDGLTALVNRTRFLEALDTACLDAKRGRIRFMLLLIDLDYFKSVNDAYGHARGDQMLVTVASRLKLSMRSTDIVARLGGDEFAVLAPVPTAEDAMRLARRVVENVNQDVDLNGVTIRPSVTVGGVLAPDSSTDPERLMLLADEAMYKAKAAGRNGWRFASFDQTPPPPPQRHVLADDFDTPAEIVFLD